MTERARPLHGKAVFDRLIVLGFSLSWALAFLPIAPSILSREHALATGAGILAGYLAADFLAGCVHWIADRFFEPDTPLLGPMLIAPFREHHEDPLSITRHDFFEISGNNALVTLPLVLALLALPDPGDRLTHAMTVFGLSLSLAVFMTNQFHAWAHVPSPPGPIQRLQGLRLILTPASHARHHARAHDCAYCVTSGWLNPALDRMRLFERIEGRLSRSRQQQDRTT